MQAVYNRYLSVGVSFFAVYEVLYSLIGIYTCDLDETLYSKDIYNILSIINV